MTTVPNLLLIARREYLVRLRTRSFVLGTALLVAAVIGVALLPVITRYIDRNVTQEVAVWIGTNDVAGDPVASFDQLLNASTGQGAPDPADRAYTVSQATDLPTARQAVVAGKLAAVLGIERGSDGELAFTLYTAEPSATTTRTAMLATTSLAIADRLERMGVAPAAQVGLFAPARLATAAADPAVTGPTPDPVQTATDGLLGFGLTILTFMLIVLYGNWIAMSVVEEKSSRVMEVILNAATPFQLLTGKVLGVGAVALTQYAALVGAGCVALLVQGPLASTVLGQGSTDVALPAGLTPAMLILLGVFGVLGFLLYGVLYAAAGSLVSRQEDVQAAVMPLVLVSTAAYIVSAYSSLGTLDIGREWLALLAQVPFMSPFLMVGRIGAGGVSAAEIALSIALLVGAIAVSLWIAARIYAAGVLLYGQRPGVRSIWRMARTGM
jgi:ABC-2 type transport system permease protein